MSTVTQRKMYVFAYNPNRKKFEGVSQAWFDNRGVESKELWDKLRHNLAEKKAEYKKGNLTVKGVKVCVVYGYGLSEQWINNTILGVSNTTDKQNPKALADNYYYDLNEFFKKLFKESERYVYQGFEKISANNEKNTLTYDLLVKDLRYKPEDKTNTEKSEKKIQEEINKFNKSKEAYAGFETVSGGTRSGLGGEKNELNILMVTYIDGQNK